MKSEHVLVIDDDESIRETAALALEKNGFRVERAASLAEARSALTRSRFALILSDIYFPGETALPLLEEVRERGLSTPVILMTARGSVETAAFATRAGAFDYIGKPFDLDHLLVRVRSALRPPDDTPATLDAPADSMIIGSHPAMIDVYKAIARVAPLRVPVLIQGETGTGKELVAHAIHDLAAHHDRPFVAVNCAAIPDTLLESELFGYVRGAFTDARRDRKGAFARADGGTLLLDEIGDISPSFQVKILRFLQDGVVAPLGADRGEKVSVRILAATNRDLPSLVAAGTFREDLFFRLAGYEIHVPPLRQRQSDIPLLVEHFRTRLAREIGVSAPPPATAAVLRVFGVHPWRGNVRELEQAVRRMLIDGGTLSDAALARSVLDELGSAAAVSDPTATDAAVARPPAADASLTTLEEAEQKHILGVLAATGGNRTRAAFILGIERKTLARKLERYRAGDGAAAGAEE